MGEKKRKKEKKKETIKTKTGPTLRLLDLVKTSVWNVYGQMSEQPKKKKKET